MEILLSLGAVVKLKDMDGKVMIIGYYPEDDISEEIYQYLTVSYPLGFHPETKLIMIDREMIEEVLFEGYENDLSQKYKEAISIVMNTEIEVL